eukprot:scaffold7287_cov138-Skeletonema_menzelii.AAC.4
MMMKLLSIVDLALIAINIFNAFVLFAHLHPVESPLKKLLLVRMQQMVSGVHSTRYGVVFVQLFLDRLLDIEKEVARHDIVDFTPPTKSVMDTLLTPYKPFISVESTGLSRVPSNTPHLFVSNHSLYGIEMPLLLNELYQNRDVFPRGLADHLHFATLNGPIVRAFGGVDGTKENVDALMEKGESVLVYPGGGHEVLKHSSVPRYELMWKQRVGFARCAIKHGYPILPCACVGTEDMFESVCDIPTGYKGIVIPISVTSPSKVQKVYFWFGEPIETKQYNGEYARDDYAKEVRDKTKMAIEYGIKELKVKQASDPERYTVDQYKSKIRSKFCSSSVSVAVSDDEHSLKED